MGTVLLGKDHLLFPSVLNRKSGYNVERRRKERK
jgi:hypothetical protein